MFVLTLVLYALARFGSPTLAGWLSFAAVAPGLAASPLAGALIDRFGAARAIAWDMLASAGGVAYWRSSPGSSCARVADAQIFRGAVKPPNSRSKRLAKASVEWSSR